MKPAKPLIPKGKDQSNAVTKEPSKNTYDTLAILNIEFWISRVQVNIEVAAASTLTLSTYLPFASG